MGISFKELKKNRMTSAEKWVLELIEGVEPETNEDGVVQWWKDGMLLFIQVFKNGYLRVVYSVWEVLREKFGLNDNEIIELLTNLLYDYTNKGKLKI